MRTLMVSLMALLVVICVEQADAILITSTADTSVDSKVIDLSNFVPGFAVEARTPIEIDTFPDEMVTLKRGPEHWPTIFGGETHIRFGLGSNGGWRFTRAGYIGLGSDGRNLTMRIEIESGPVSEFGVFMNYAVEPGLVGATITARDENLKFSSNTRWTFRRQSRHLIKLMPAPFGDSSEI